MIRTKTYQTDYQLRVENAFVAAQLAENPGSGTKPSPGCVLGLYALGLFCAVEVSYRGVEIRQQGGASIKGVALIENVVLVTGVGADVLENSLDEVPLVAQQIASGGALPATLLPIFNDGTNEDFIWFPDHSRHAIILAGLLRVFERLVLAFERSNDVNWHDDCCDGYCPPQQDCFEPTAMVAAVREMRVRATKMIGVRRVMES